jgi:organic hydroperoxide reductase OsmC/OhrA
METQVAKIDSVRRTLAGLTSRLNETESKARSREWPHNSLSGVVRAYVIQQTAIAHGLISTIASQLGFRGPGMIEQPLEGSTVTCFIGTTMMLAQTSGVTAQEAEQATFASAEQLKKQVVEIVRHVEAVVEGEETVEGKQLNHGPLHYK